MKTFIVLLVTVYSAMFFSCEKNSNSNKTDTLAVHIPDSIKTQEEPLTFLRSLSKTDILTKFFNPYKISNDTAIWKQDLESIEIKLSNDDYIHTVIDTICNLGTSHIILFTSYETLTDGRPHICHPCNADYSIATIVQENNHYKIISFRKHLTTKGSMGQGASVAVVTFKGSEDNDLTCLKFEDGWIGGGTMMEAAEYFNIEDFSSLVYLETHNSNEGLCDEGDLKCINKTERELIPFNKHASKKPAIIIKYKHTYYNKKLIIIKKSDTLIYDGDHFNKDIYYEGV